MSYDVAEHLETEDDPYAKAPRKKPRSAAAGLWKIFLRRQGLAYIIDLVVRVLPLLAILVILSVTDRLPGIRNLGGWVLAAAYAVIADDG